MNQLLEPRRNEAPENIGDLLEFNRRLRPQDPAILAPGFAPLSFAALDAQFTTIKQQLKNAGITPGHRVALIMPNSSATAVLTLALIDFCTLIPLNPDYREREFDYFFNTAEVDAVAQEQNRLALRTRGLDDLADRPGQVRVLTLCLHPGK